MSVISKVYFTVRNEGIGSLVNRAARYGAYKTRRALMDKRETIAEWEALRGSYSGRVFLVGNGPSLNQTPLYLLGGERTMCFNRFDLMLERLNWRPTFYSCNDDRVLLDIIPIVNRMSRLVEHAFYPDIHPYYVDFRGRIDKLPNVHWLYMGGTTFSDRLPWCGIQKTIANAGLQVLSWLGFREIYLIGLDMTYTIPQGARLENVRDITATEDNDESHFDPRYFGKGRAFHVPMLDETFVKFREAKQFFGERGVRIVNSTVGGALEEFPRVPFDEVLGIPLERQRTIYRDLVEEKLAKRFDVLDAIGAAPAPAAPGDVDESWPVFRVPATAAGSYIMKHVFEFVPFGPLDGTYLFVNRSMVAASADPIGTSA
jgi:hypothetical protein